MDDDSKKNLIFLENFFKRKKDNVLNIRQPAQVNNFDIFEEEEKVEKPKRKNSQKLKTINNTYGVIQRKYNIVKESTIFQELDKTKNFNLITNLKNHYKNYLYDSISKQKSLKNSMFRTARNDNFIRQKSTININDIYESKLKNVSKIIIFNNILYIECNT